MENNKQKIIKRFLWLSDKYHRMSLLFNELGKSIEITSRNMNEKELRVYIKTLNLDLEKIKKMSKGFEGIELKNIQKDT